LTYGILVDLGTNLDQLHEDERGFTFRKRGPLDMRFDVKSVSSPLRTRGGGDANGSVVRTAGNIVNRWSETRLAGIFGRYADEPYTIEIAWDIVRWMETLPWERGGIHSTLELQYVIEKAVEGIVSSSSNYAGTSPGKEEDGVGGGAHEKGGTKRACIANNICLSADHQTLDR
jgi:16S rRNA C1402 N4-methylase RsmH